MNSDEPSDDRTLHGDDQKGMVMQPKFTRSLLALLATLEPIDEEFPVIEDLSIDDVEL